MFGSLNTPVKTAEEASSKWQQLSQNLANLQRGGAMDTLSMQRNPELYKGLSGLASRGMNAGGSLERAATGLGTQGAQAALGASQGVTGQLASNIAQGIQGIDLPMLQGRDMAAAQKYASDVQSKSGLGGLINAMFGG